MLSSRATPASVLSPSSAFARVAGRSARHALPAHARAYIPLVVLRAPSPFTVGLGRGFVAPAARLYSTGTEQRSTTTTTVPPPAPAPTNVSASSEKPAVAVPAPGTPAPPVPAQPDTKAVEAADKEKDVSKVDKKPTGPWHKRAWAVVKKEAAHYWAGTKLLGQEIKISAKLQYKVLQGGQLTRRERRQLRRTTADLVRLLPFSVFILIPFMEFLLPVALKLFPNMLPSTFEGQMAKDEKERKLLRVRLEMAKFLQETVRENGLKANNVVHSDEFKDFFRKVRSTGESPSPEDIIRVAKLFENEITLDNLTRPQLVSVCRYMNINAFGTDNFLKHHIRSRLEQLRVDDMMIQSEGVDSLSTKELQQACQSRGIRFQGMSPTRLREELEQWIDLHYTNKISGVLLILSRAFNFDNKGEDVLSSLESTLASLPENLIDETELAAYKDDVGYKQKLEVLQQQQELIEDEAEQEQEEAAARKEKKEVEAAAKEAEAAAKEAAKAADETAAADKAVTEEAVAEATGAPEAIPTPESAGPAEEATIEAIKAEVKEDVKEAKDAEEDSAKMTQEQLNELAEALSVLTSKSSIAKERDELQALFEDNLLSEAESKKDPESTDSKSVAVSKRVRSMIKKLDAQLEKYDERVGSSLNLIHTNAKGQISLADLTRALLSIKHAPPEDVIEKLGKKLDVDQDGFVELDHVLELAQDHGLGLGIVHDDAAALINKGVDIRQSKDMKEVKEKDLKPKREDIVDE